MNMLQINEKICPIKENVTYVCNFADQLLEYLCHFLCNIFKLLKYDQIVILTINDNHIWHQNSYYKFGTDFKKVFPLRHKQIYMKNLSYM